MYLFRSGRIHGYSDGVRSETGGVTHRPSPSQFPDKQAPHATHGSHRLPVASHFCEVPALLPSALRERRFITTAKPDAQSSLRPTPIPRSGRGATNGEHGLLGLTSPEGANAFDPSLTASPRGAERATPVASIACFHHHPCSAHLVGVPVGRSPCPPQHESLRPRLGGWRWRRRCR